MDHHDDATAAAVEALVSIPTGTEEHGDQQYETTGGPSPQAFPAAGDADQDYQPETRYDPYAHSGGQEGDIPTVPVNDGHISADGQDAVYRPAKKPKGEKRKYKNPGATRPPAFTGAVGEVKEDNPNACTNCSGTVTPLWRRGPNDELLCNACGLFYKLHQKMRPAALAKPRVGPTGDPNPDTRIECSNCKTQTTPMWRKDPTTGSLVCNACSLYYKLHGRPRPPGTTQGGGPKKRRTNAAGKSGAGNKAHQIDNSALENVHGAGDDNALENVHGSAPDAGLEQPADSIGHQFDHVWDPVAQGDAGASYPSGDDTTRQEDGGASGTEAIHPAFRTTDGSGATSATVPQYDPALASRAAEALLRTTEGGDIFTTAHSGDWPSGAPAVANDVFGNQGGSRHVSEHAE